jgi:RNA polymerase sigma factor (sigma-70 family)
LNRTRDIARPAGDAARKRAALELISRHEPSLKRTARRFSLNEGDAEDAYQRALEIVLTKAPTTDPQELIRWTQTVTKHEALAVRRSRERLLGHQPRETAEGALLDPLVLIPAGGDGPAEQVERREEIARSREALRTLKPAELRALGLLAEGYSYVEIGEMTGYSQTKVNRVLAEGRSRFRDMVSRSEDGTRCRELRPILSAFCDGEAGARDAETIREHLRACAHCRATMRAYRAAPGLAGALVPTLPLPTRSMLGRLHALLARTAARTPAPAKLAAVCAAGAIGGAATGVVPLPHANRAPTPSPSPVERSAAGPSRASRAIKPRRAARSHRRRDRPSRPVAEAADSAGEVEAPPEAVEYESPPPEPVETVSSAGAPESSGSAAGEFGP